VLRIELSALSPQELKRLLDQARARNQSALAEQLMAELDARPSRAADLHEPLAMNWAPTHDDSDFLESNPATAPRRRNGVMAVTAVIAAVVSAAVTWGISVPPERSGEPAGVTPPRAAVILASIAPVSAPEPGPTRTVSEPVRVALASPDRPAAAAPRTKANPCFDLPTAAERLVCGYPSLANRDREMRRALDRARATGGDLRALEAEQAQFERTNENVADWRILAEQYDRRTRELDERIAEAARSEPPF
jgi:hypothetical protein